MKIKNIERPLISLLILATSFFSCSENLNVNGIDENIYMQNENTLAFITDKFGNSVIDSLTFRNDGSTELCIRSSKDVNENVNFELEYDESVLIDYNQVNNTSYKLFPSELISYNKTVSMEKGSSISSKFLVKYSTDKSLDPLGTYVIPFKAVTKSGSVKMSETKSSFLLFLKDMSKLPTPDKSSGIKIFSCSGQETNPLNTLTLTLKNSGKPLIDAVIIFSANINYNAETGRVYIYNNEYCQHYLDYREKYLKPLQDRGIKVLWGILGNHDISGIANLSDEAARGFAQDLKKMCDAYNLDGVFFDDEYSNYPYTNIPNGFVSPSSSASSRLCYETKKAMPDKLVTVYVYSTTRSLYEVDGVQAGEYVDYALHDYGAGSDLSSNYPGMPKSAMGLYSQEFAQGRFASDSKLQFIRDNGYGSHMIFAMSPFRATWSGQLDAMQRMARIFYDDELVWDGKKYSKDW